MKIQILGSGPLFEQAERLARAAGYELVSNGADAVLPATEMEQMKHIHAQLNLGSLKPGRAALKKKVG